MIPLQQPELAVKDGESVPSLNWGIRVYLFPPSGGQS